MMRPRPTPLAPTWREILRVALLCGAVALGALTGASAAGHLVAAVRGALWTGAFQNATCLGPACLVTTPFVEISWGEYSNPNTPIPAPGTINYPGAGATSAGGGGSSSASGLSGSSSP